jgi:hypothetical protein
MTATWTPTQTDLLPASTTTVIYPNPSHGGPVNILPPFFTGSSDVKIQVYTQAFRKVRETTTYLARYGVVVLEPKDAEGIPLANGLYYIVITIKNSQAILKLSVLR